MTIRAKVLLLLGVALSLVVLMGVAVHRETHRGLLLQRWTLGVQEQRTLYSQLRGEALVFLGDLQRVHGSGALTEPVLNQYRRRLDSHFSRLRELAELQEGQTRSPRSQEKQHLARLEQVMRVWAERAEERVRRLPSGIGSDGAHPRETINDFGRNVEPVLVAALEIEEDELDELRVAAEQGVRTSRLFSIFVPLASLAVMLGLALAILVPMNRRLRELLTAVERIGRGEFQHTLPEKSHDEFSALARGFNQMAQEIKASQSRLVHADRMASLGRTVASVGHEINNPLAYVISNLSYAHEELGRERRELTEPERKELLEALDEAREGAARVRFIVQDLKSLSRTDDESTAPVDIVAVVREVARMASHELQGRARLVEDCAGVPLVRGNATRLGQVFLNLIVNAAQAIAPGNLEKNEIRVVARPGAEGHITVEVSDTGCGIPAENLERIFDPFFTTKPVGEGTGLGLAVCQTIIQSLGGTITVESTPGQGTTFRIILPIASE
jgi:two-component system NtrC family sensor kinase